MRKVEGVIRTNRVTTGMRASITLPMTHSKGTQKELKELQADGISA